MLEKIANYFDCSMPLHRHSISCRAVSVFLEVFLAAAHIILCFCSELINAYRDRRKELRNSEDHVSISIE